MDWLACNAHSKTLRVCIRYTYIAVIRALASFGHRVHMRNENKLHNCIALHCLFLPFKNVIFDFDFECSLFRNKMSTKKIRLKYQNL